MPKSGYGSQKKSGDSSRLKSDSRFLIKKKHLAITDRWSLNIDS